MKIVEQSFEILTPISENGEQELRMIEQVGRVCYKSEERISDFDATKRFIGNLIKRGHLAMIEHSILSVKFTVDRGVTHELVRHRLASFAQESTRYCNYSGDKFGNEITVINPSFFQGGMYDAWKYKTEQAEKNYFDLLETGATPEQARAVLPTCVKADIVVTANYREWRNIFSLRADKHAHPQMREIMNKLLAEVKEKIPVVFDDIQGDTEV